MDNNYKKKLTSNCFSISDYSKCEKFDLVGKSSRSLFEGPYSLFDQYNDRPAFKNAAGTLYFYYHIQVDCEFWALGASVGNTTSLAYTFDAPRDPAEISNPWQVSLTSTAAQTWTMDSNIRVICL